jgi:hypothetical protein
MNERKLRRLLGRIVLAALPLPAMACGGVATYQDTDGQGGDAGTGGGTAGRGGSGGSSSTAGVGGTISYGGVVGSGGTLVGGFGGGAGTGQGGSGGLSCQSGPTSCLDFSSFVVDSACVGDAEFPTLEQCSFLCNRVGTCPCGGSSPNCVIASRDALSATVQCAPSCVAGRRPAAFTPTTEHGADLGAHFARAAELEALAVIAFRNLRAELLELGAPSRLLRALTSAARDEVRHARATRRLARRFGRATAEPHALPRAARSIEAIAIENAVEGCVREAYGALSAVWQAQAAADPSVRGALRKIARDEVRHAALSMKVQRWLEPRLDPQGRRRVAEAKRAAVRELRAELDVTPPEPTVRLAGYPDRAQAQLLLDGLEVRLWS